MPVPRLVIRVFSLTWVACISIFGLGSPQACSAADWPKWRGPTGDGHLAIDEAPIRSLPEDPEITLKIPLGGGFASPVVSQGRLYVFDNQQGDETIAAIDLKTQRTIWSHAVDKTFKDGQGLPGPRNTPQVDGDRLYAVSCRGELQCLDTASGRLLWQRNYDEDYGATFVGEKGNVQGAARHGNNGSPLIDGDRLIACAGGTSGASVVCLNKYTGGLIWKSQNDRAGYAPPVRANVGGIDQLFCYTVEGFMSLNPSNGQLYWRFPVSTPFGRHVTTPLVYQGLVVISSVEEGLIATRTTQKDQQAIHTRAWQSKVSAINFSSPVRVGGYLYGLGPQKDLICVDIATGEQQWSQQGYIFTSAEQAHASFIVSNDRILALTDTGEIVLFAADPNEFIELGRVQVCGKTWSNPAYSDGVLYLRDGLRKRGKLYGIRLQKPEEDH